MNDKYGKPRQSDAEAQETSEHDDHLTGDVDAILDEIDEVLDENAEEFVRSYVLKGGQGWSGFFTPEFYVGAAAAGVLSGATYDVFKAVIRRITKALLQVPGRSPLTPQEYEAAGISEYEATMIKEAWKTAKRLVKRRDIQHSIDEATALHWVLFTIELGRSLGSVHLGAKRYERLARMGTSIDEPLEASQLAARIIDQWLEENEASVRSKKRKSK